MKDDMWMQAWNEAHPNFSADVDRGLARLRTSFSRLIRGVRAVPAAARSRTAKH